MQIKKAEWGKKKKKNTKASQLLRSAAPATAAVLDIKS